MRDVESKFKMIRPVPWLVIGVFGLLTVLYNLGSIQIGEYIVRPFWAAVAILLLVALSFLLRSLFTVVLPANVMAFRALRLLLRERKLHRRYLAEGGQLPYHDWRYTDGWEQTRALWVEEKSPHLRLEGLETRSNWLARRT